MFCGAGRSERSSILLAGCHTAICLSAGDPSKIKYAPSRRPSPALRVEQIRSLVAIPEFRYKKRLFQTTPIFILHILPVIHYLEFVHLRLDELLLNMLRPVTIDSEIEEEIKESYYVRSSSILDDSNRPKLKSHRCCIRAPCTLILNRSHHLLRISRDHFNRVENRKILSL